MTKFTAPIWTVPIAQHPTRPPSRSATGKPLTNDFPLTMTQRGPRIGHRLSIPAKPPQFRAATGVPKTLLELAD